METNNLADAKERTTLISTIYLFVVGVAALVACALAVAGYRIWALRRNLLDIPNERSSHTEPTPRGGGLAIAAILLAAFIVVQLLDYGLPPKVFWGYLVGALIIVAISLLDDLTEISVRVRLPIHLLAALVFASSAGFVHRVYLPFLGDFELGWFGLPLTVFWIAGFTNAFNFMDGIDGLAAGQAVITALCWFVITYVMGLTGLTIVCVVIAGASLGFLLHNLPPARIFMGDAGSTLLGFTFATLPILTFSKEHGSRLFIVAASCVAPFVFDTTLTILRRAVRKDRIFKAHRTHLYQRLTGLGYVHGAVTILYVGTGLISSALGLAYLWGSDLIAVVALLIILLLMISLAAGVTWLERTSRLFWAKLMDSNTQTGLTERLRRHWLSAGTQTILDLTVLSAAFIVAYLVRFDFQIPRNFWHGMLSQLPVVVLMQFVALSLVGGRNFIWRYAGMEHIKTFLYAALASFTIAALTRLLLPESHHTWRVPLSVNFVDTILAFGGTFGLRVFRRAVYENQKRRGQLKRRLATTRQNVLLIGAGQAGVLAAKEINSRGDLDLNIKGFVDDDPQKLARIVLKNHKVVGTTADLPRLVSTLDIDHVVITISQASRQDIKRIVRICEEIPIKVRIIAGLYEMIQGRVQIDPIRDVQIEDLLGREPVQLDIDSISRELAGKVVMVTGAGGSIGSELARQVIRFGPSRLLLVERAEFALFHIDRELKAIDDDNRVVPLVADVGDVVNMQRIFSKYSPEVVIHAAAHKHVPLMEANASEAIRNNVLNSRLLCELASQFGAEAFVFISTDKAVRPSSIMGASKRVAELVVQHFGRLSRTRFVAVRFGNVIGSNGSAVPIFQEQIRKGGPVTITDKRMQRYFMTIPEAAQLVLQASTIGKGGEVFLLHMGEPVRIVELAEALISLSGLKPYEEIEILETGIRPGEKLYEELTFEAEAALPTSHPKIFISKIHLGDGGAIEAAVERLAKLVEEGTEEQIRSALMQILPENNFATVPDSNPDAIESDAFAVGAT